MHELPHGCQRVGRRGSRSLSLVIWMVHFVVEGGTYWSGGITHPRLGHPPSLWKVWAPVKAENSDTATAAMELILESMMMYLMDQFPKYYWELPCAGERPCLLKVFSLHRAPFVLHRCRNASTLSQTACFHAHVFDYLLAICLQLHLSVFVYVHHQSTCKDARRLIG